MVQKVLRAGRCEFGDGHSLSRYGKPMDIIDLRDFYTSRLGLAAQQLLRSRLAPRLAMAPDQIVMGLGFAAPYLPDRLDESARVFSFMLARQGVVQWPPQGLVRSALVDEFDLPLLESTVDLAVVVHGLELSDSPPDMLAEIWRVLAPQGRLILVVPNRRGLWSASDRSPFGHGQPFSRPQLARLLKDAKFTPLSWSNALFAPPISRVMGPVAARYLERAGGVLAPGLSGLIIVEAMKQVYAFSSGKRARRLVPRLSPVLLPRPTGKLR
jgi:SAM-dependent methyltransferase